MSLCGYANLDKIIPRFNKSSLPFDYDDDSINFD